MNSTTSLSQSVKQQISQATSQAIRKALVSYRTLGVVGVSLGVASLSGLSSVAHAVTDKAVGELAEIVVTATRHEESISKVPLSVQAIDQEALDFKGIKDIQDMVRFTPGVSIDTSGTNAISIRGISSSGGAGTTGIYIDDTPIQVRALGFNPDDTLPRAFDLDRVEVLRGPQGTLFGAGSEGGTVRYLMTPASVSKTSTYARSEVSVTEGGAPSFEAGYAHGAPLVEGVLGVRASLFYRYDGGWINRVDPTGTSTVESNINHVNTLAGRFALILKPNDSLVIEPSFIYQNSRKHDEDTYWPNYSNPAQGRFNTATPQRLPVPDEYELSAIRVTYSMPSMDLVSNSSYYHRNEQTAYQGTVYDLAYLQGLGWPSKQNSCGSASTTATPPCSWYPLLDANGIHLPAGFGNFVTPNTITNLQDTLTQELRLQSNDANARVKWTLGGFFTISAERSVEELKDPNGQVPALFQALFGSASDALYGPYYYCNGQGTPGQSLPNCEIYYNNNRGHDRQAALFGEAAIKVTERQTLTLGGRYAKLSFDIQHHGDGYENYGPDYRNGAAKESAFTPKVGYAFQHDPNNLYYATYAKGFRPGGANAPLPAFCQGQGGLSQTGYPNGAPLTYGPDTTQSYELGAKNNFNNRLKLASSVYYIRWQNIQQNIYVGYNCGLQFTDNLGTAVAKGFDTQLDWAINEHWTVDGSLGYTSARYTEGTPAPKPLLVSAGDAIAGEAAISGGPGSIAPWSAAVGVQADFNWLEHESFARLDVGYQGANHWPTANLDANTVQFSPDSFFLPSTTFVSTRVGMRFGDLSAALFVDNLLNSHTLTNYQLAQYDANNPANANNPPTSSQRNDYTFRPRTIGITFTYRH